MRRRGRCGMDRATGAFLRGFDHLAQSVIDILTTRAGVPFAATGERVMLHPYGSRLRALQDRPFNAVNRLRYIVATVQALRRWEPDLRVSRVTLGMVRPGSVTITIAGTWRPTGRAVLLENLEIVR